MTPAPRSGPRRGPGALLRALVLIAACAGWPAGAWPPVATAAGTTPGVAAGVATSSGTGPGPTAPLVAAVESVGMTVADAERSADFFTGVLDFVRVSEVTVEGGDYARLQGVRGARVRVVRLRLGGEFLDLIEYRSPRGRPVPSDLRGNDRAFQHVAIIVSDMDRAYARLRQNRVTHASSGPQTLPAWNPAAGGIRAFYFRDPDGHFLEILKYPPGKGDPRWQVEDRLFLGIDHTAIVVDDTDASLRLYRDRLGMRIAGESENHGTEQEHLNGVFGARLRITALRAARGPGIELLEYLAPRDGRAGPPDLRGNDLLHWETRLEVADAAGAAETARASGGRLVSPGAVDLGGVLGLRSGVLMRDADGHALLLGTPAGPPRARAAASERTPSNGGREP